MWAAQYFWGDKPYSFVTSGGLGTMGFEVPAAIGVQFARPHDTVWAFCGDGGFQMTMQELALCTEYELPIKFAIINNNYLGMVRQWQDAFYAGNKQSRAHVPAGLREARRGDGHHGHPRHATSRRWSRRSRRRCGTPAPCCSTSRSRSRELLSR